MVAATWPAPADPPPVRAVPSPGPFAELLGQPYQRLKVAVLRTLAELPRSTWTATEAQQALTWLDPATSARILGELRADGLVVQAGAGGDRAGLRLSDEAHLVAAVCAVLAVPRIEPERMVRVLGAAMALARAAGLDERAASAPLTAAIALLEADMAAIERRLGAADEPGLLAAVRLAAAHVQDMGALLTSAGREGPTEPREDAPVDPEGPEREERAARLAERLGALAAEVEAGLAGTGDAAAPDAGDLRAMVAATGLDVLAGLVAGQLRPPPAVPPVRATVALEALADHLGLPEPVAVPLPAPAALPIEPPDAVPDFVQVAADALTWLGGLGDSDLARWVVGGTWPEATARLAAAVEAWSRWGPSGDGTLAAVLEPEAAFEVVGQDEVGVITPTGVRRPGGEAE